MDAELLRAASSSTWHSDPTFNVIKLEGVKVFIERHRKMSKAILEPV
jgi:hypothetical protein